MLVYFKKIRNSLLRSGAVRKYVFYALGEVVLVMIGILLALQVDTWNTQRELQKKELVYLREIKGNLQADRETLKSVLSFNTLKDSVLDTTLKMFFSDSSEVAFALTFESRMPLLAQYQVFESNRIAFENMLGAQSIDIITDDSLRILLSSYYRDRGFDDGTQERVKQLTRIFVDNITPKLMNAEIIQKYYGKASDFESAAEISMKKDRQLFGDLFGMQQNLFSHNIYLEELGAEIKLLDAAIQTYLNEKLK
ncbi:DUF6090 family protein [Robiginitalea sp. IMCC44478]|uniref:DUF6090 family protein n=1 Tax=Robiginitalea sp. IMCC44478 TaxID=3459122 RepID=UPI0040434D7F